MQIILLILGLIFALCGVVLIYDARILTYKLFSFGDQNEATMGLKIFGFILSMVGSFIIYFNI